MTVISTSSTIQYVDDSVSTTDANSLTIVKEFIVTDSYTGSWRIVFDLLGDYDSEPAYAQIYKNGSAYPGAILQYVNGFPPDYSYKTFSQDFSSISISSGDHIQIYAYIYDPGYAASVKNFRIEYTLPSGSLGGAAFASSPNGARIWIDGVDKGVNTPDTIANLSTGGHSYTLKLSGYANATGSFSVSTATTTIVPTVTMTTATTGSASFTSNPSGATIWIDGSNTGIITPNTITGISAGVHTYKLVLAGYNVLSGNFTATSGQTTNISQILSGTATAFLAAGD